MIASDFAFSVVMTCQDFQLIETSAWLLLTIVSLIKLTKTFAKLALVVII
jgi:hypothetical protein